MRGCIFVKTVCVLTIATSSSCCHGDVIESRLCLCRLFFQKLSNISHYVCVFVLFCNFWGGGGGGVRVTPVYHAHFNLFCVFTLGLHSLVDLDNKMILKVINRLNLTNVFSCKSCGLTPFCMTTTVPSVALLPLSPPVSVKLRNSC